VWEQHLVEAFERSTRIHFLVTRAIAELTLFMLRNRKGDLRREVWSEALGLRDLLKFEFFFSRRRDFEQELVSAATLIDPEWEGRNTAEPIITPQQVGLWFERTRPHFAHIVLRPFMDAYLVVAHELAEGDPSKPIDEQELLQRSLGLGRQWVLQRKIHSAESVTLELFKNALKLAKHRNLLEPGPDVQDRRRAFVDEVGRIVAELSALALAEAESGRSS